MKIKATLMKPIKLSTSVDIDEALKSGTTSITIPIDVSNYEKSILPYYTEYELFINKIHEQLVQSFLYEILNTVTNSIIEPRPLFVYHVDCDDNVISLFKIYAHQKVYQIYL